MEEIPAFSTRRLHLPRGAAIMKRDVNTNNATLNMKSLWIGTGSSILCGLDGGGAPCKQAVDKNRIEELEHQSCRQLRNNVDPGVLNCTRSICITGTHGFALDFSTGTLGAF